MHRRPLLLPTLVAAGAIFLAGCGGGSGPGVANVNSSTSTSSPSSGGQPTQAQLQRDVVRFVGCMGSHGVSVPDPTVTPRGFKNAFVHPSPAFQSAYTVCGHLLPAGRATQQSTTRSQAQTVALLAFARCLRGHGFPSFPDPNGSGQLTHEMLANARIDLHQPALLAAADGCAGVTHGVITKAVIARFVAGE